MTPQGPGPKPATRETRERAEIRSRASLASYLDAAIRGLSVDGAEAELAAAFDCPGSVPLVMFESRERQPETRDATPAPATVGTNLSPIVPALFQRSAAAWLGIEMPSVGSGDAGYPIVGTSVTGGPKAKVGSRGRNGRKFHGQNGPAAADHGIVQVPRGKMRRACLVWRTRYGRTCRAS